MAEPSQKSVEPLDRRADSLTQHHYERIANISGILAWQLQDYLLSRYNFLLLIYENRAALQEQLAVVASEAARDSFYYFCHALFRFDAFQREASSVYLLRGVGAAAALRRLCNVFLGCLPQGATQNAIDVYRIVCYLGTPGVAELAIHDFMSRSTKKAALEDEFAAYEAWIRNASPDLATAAGALIEYHELLSRELGFTGQDWSGEKALAPTHAASREVWTIQSRAVALESARSAESLPRPLARMRASVQAPSPEALPQVTASQEPVPSRTDQSRETGGEPPQRSPSITVYVSKGGKFVHGTDAGVVVAGSARGDVTGTKTVGGSEVRGDSILAKIKRRTAARKPANKGTPT